MRKLHIFFLFGFLLSIACQNVRQNSSEPIAQKPDYQITENSIRQHILFLASDSMKGRATGTPEMKTVRQYIANCFDSAGLNKLASYGDSYFQPFHLSGLRAEMILKSLQADTTATRLNAYNVVGILPGKDSVLCNEYIVIGAHYDHVGVGYFATRSRDKAVHHGADDNASGTAVMIELANKMNSLRDSLKRSIIFIAYDAEELGLVGSGLFTNSPPVNISKIKLAINLDMVGRVNDSTGIVISGGHLFKDGESWIADAGKNIGIPISTKDIVVFGSDHYRFFQKGIPFIMPMPTMHDDYHSSRDSEDKINYNGALNIANFITEITKTACNCDSIVPVTEKFKR